MAEIDAEDSDDLERIYVASTLRLAKRVEEWLTMAGVDYAVKVEPFGRSLLFGTVRMGAAFYVPSGQASYCRDQLTAGGLGGGVVDTPE